jgi:sarcosine oxidase
MPGAWRCVRSAVPASFYFWIFVGATCRVALLLLTMRTHFHTIVLGLGGIGAAATYWLARRVGGAVLGLEQFELFHARGESQDHSRIIRHSYHTPAYVALTQQAYAAWAALEGELGASSLLKPAD